MGNQQSLFNHLLNTYLRSRKKLARLSSQGKNQRRQSLLRKRLEKLVFKLKSLQKSLRLAGAGLPFLVGATFLTGGEAKAQYFAPETLNPFNLDTAYANRPTFADLDDDGDMDMMLGDTTGNNLYYENSGSATAANFNAPLTNPFGLTAAPYFNFPYFVDLDTDGDFDLLTGDIYGFLYYYQNTGTAGAPAFASPVTTMFSLPLSIGDYTATLSMGDVDNDGDKDLFVGSFSGDFHYFPNTGTASAPAFGAEQINPFGISIPGDSISVPVLGDLDGDGDFDLLSGSYYGNFHYYENTGTVAAPNFAAAQINPFGLMEVYNGISLPELVDLDSDGDLDLMSGDYYGAWHYFENDESLLIHSVNTTSDVLNVFPNPASHKVSIFTPTSIAQKIVVSDVSGKEMVSFMPDQQKTTLDVAWFERGIYMVNVYTKTGMETIKLVKH